MSERQDELLKQQKRMEAIIELTGHPAWLVFQEDLEEAMEMQNNLATVHTEKDLFAAQGRMQVLQNIIHTRNTATAHLAELEKNLLDPDDTSEVALIDDIPGEGHEQL